MHSITGLQSTYRYSTPRRPVIHHNTIQNIIPQGYSINMGLDSAKRLLPHLSPANANTVAYLMLDEMDVMMAAVYITNFNDTRVLDRIAYKFPQLASMIRESGQKSIAPLKTHRIERMSGLDYMDALRSPTPLPYDDLEKIVKASGIPAVEFVKHWRDIGWVYNVRGLRTLGVPLNVLMPLIKNAPYYTRKECMNNMCDEIARHNEKNTMLSELWDGE